MADPATAFEAFKACLDQIPASENRAYTFMKDFQPLIAAALAFIAGLAAWLKLREDRKVAELAEREKKKALYWRTHTEAGIARSLRMLNGCNRNLRIFASDETLPKHSAKFLSYILTDVIKYSSELKEALDPYVVNFTWQEGKH